jgi:predicted transcriptional regulator
MDMFLRTRGERIFDIIIGGTRGGPMRLSIVVLLSKRSMNTNEIARNLRIDYKTAEYHLRVLSQNCIVSRKGDGYASKFSLTPIFKSYWEKAHKLEKKSKK